MIISKTTITWNIYMGQEVGPGRYMVMLSNHAMKAATFDSSERWVDEAGNSLHGSVCENFVVMYASGSDIKHLS